MPLNSLKDFIREQALSLGFGAIGFARAERCRTQPVYEDWLKKEYCAGMDYLKRHSQLRSDPRLLDECAKSIVVVGAGYPSDECSCPISNHARAADYHRVLKAKLSGLASLIDKEYGRGSSGRICVDSAPLAERELAVRAGIGWIGRQGSVVSPDMGCCFFLGELMLSVELQPDTPIRPQCGECRLCLDACPSGAIMPGSLVDARRCISYLTIEHKGAIDPDMARSMDNSVFGCDRCTSVCPWNRSAKVKIMPEFNLASSAVPSLDDMAKLDEKGFITSFKNTPVYRIGLDRFLRNVKIALANTGNMH